MGGGGAFPSRHLSTTPPASDGIGIWNHSYSFTNIQVKFLVYLPTRPPLPPLLHTLNELRQGGGVNEGEGYHLQRYFSFGGTISNLARTLMGHLGGGQLWGGLWYHHPHIHIRSYRTPPARALAPLLWHAKALSTPLGACTKGSAWVRKGGGNSVHPTARMGLRTSRSGGKDGDTGWPRAGLERGGEDRAAFQQCSPKQKFTRQLFCGRTMIHFVSMFANLKIDVSTLSGMTIGLQISCTTQMVS